jgi:hypothetical protein
MGQRYKRRVEHTSNIPLYTSVADNSLTLSPIIPNLYADGRTFSDTTGWFLISKPGLKLPLNLSPPLKPIPAWTKPKIILLSIKN